MLFGWIILVLKNPGYPYDRKMVKILNCSNNYKEAGNDKKRQTNKLRKDPYSFAFEDK